MAVMNKPGYPPVDRELSLEKAPIKSLMKMIKDKGVNATHVKRDFYKMGEDFSMSDVWQPRLQINDARKNELAYLYSEANGGWDHKEFPSAVCMKIKNLDWEKPALVGGFHSCMGGLPLNGWTYAWTDEVLVDSIQDAGLLSLILNHPRHPQIKPNLDGDIIDNVCDGFKNKSLDPDDKIQVKQYIAYAAGDRDVKSRDKIYNKAMKRYNENADGTKFSLFHMTKNDSKNSTWIFAQGKNATYGGIWLPHGGNVHWTDPKFEDMPVGFKNILGGSYANDRLDNAFSKARDVLVTHPKSGPFRLYVYIDVSKTSNLKESREKVVEEFEKRKKILVKFINLSKSGKPIKDIPIILAAFYPQLRESDPKSRGKYIERTMLDPITLKPIDALTLKPLK